MLPAFPVSLVRILPAAAVAGPLTVLSHSRTLCVFGSCANLSLKGAVKSPGRRRPLIRSTPLTSKAWLPKTLLSCSQHGYHHHRAIVTT